MRIYAMYGCNRTILIVLLALFILEILAELTLCVYISAGFSGMFKTVFHKSG